MSGTATLLLDVAPNPVYYGNTVTLTATITSTGSTPATGTVLFFDNGVQIGTGTLGGKPDEATYTTATLAPGTHPITATYAGDKYNTAAQSVAPVNEVVNLAQTATGVIASPSPGAAGGPENITAIVTITAGTATPSGTVTFTSAGVTLGTAPVGNYGVAALTTPLALGTYQVVASYSGNTDVSASTSTAISLVIARATTSTIVTATPSPGFVTQAIAFSAKVTGNGGTPTGNVNFIVNGTTVGAAPLSGDGIATFTDSALPVGSYTVTASYVGDTSDGGSTSAPITEAVGLIPTQTDLAASSTGGANPQLILVTSVLNGGDGTGPTPTGTVTFSSGTTTIGSAQVNVAGVATLQPNLPAGTSYSITATYGGDADHSPSTSLVISISGTASDFTLSLSPPAVTLKTSENVTLTVNVSSGGAFTDTIGLGCASLPAGVTCHFSPLSVKVPANGAASAQLTIDTNNPLSGGASAMNRRPAGAQFAGLFLPFSVFFGWLFWRRRRSLGVFTMLLVMVLSGAALLATGCSGYSTNSAAPGTYTIQVTGAGTSSGISHYQNLALTITQ